VNQAQMFAGAGPLLRVKYLTLNMYALPAKLKDHGLPVVPARSPRQIRAAKTYGQDKQTAV